MKSTIIVGAALLAGTIIAAHSWATMGLWATSVAIIGAVHYRSVKRTHRYEV